MFLAAYLAIFYFVIGYNLPKWMLVAPIMLRSAGHVVLGICFLLLLFLIRESDIRPYKAIHPTFKAIRRLLRREAEEAIAADTADEVA